MNATGKQVIFHVGTAKTGTTHLQHLLAGRADGLRSRYGLLYPAQWRHDDGFAHHGLAREMLAGEPDVDGTFEAFRGILEDPAARSVLVSSEALTNVLIKEHSFAAFLELLLRLQKLTRVRLVMVLREYASFIESMYLHQVKVGEVVQSFDAYLAQRANWFQTLTERLVTLRRFDGIIELDVLFYDDESVVAKMERLLSVHLDEGPSRGRTGQRLSLKSQALLYRLKDFTELTAVERSRLIRVLASTPVFSDDTLGYTLFSPATRALTSRLALDAAARAGIDEYCEATVQPSAPEKQFVVLDDVPISARDINDLVSAVDGAESPRQRASSSGPVDKTSPPPAARKKIIGLVAGKNEAPRIDFCIRALSMYCDSIVYFDDNSEDDSAAIVESIADECRVERIIRNTDDRFHETVRRAQALAAGRELGGTHFVVVDADEAFTANCMEGDFLRDAILSMAPGESLEVPLIHLWRSMSAYRDDGSVWSRTRKVTAFADDGKCTYREKFIHLERVPSALAGKRRRVEGRDRGLLHFQFVNWRNLLVKQAWYRCLERVNDPSKPVEAINALYAPTKDESKLRLTRVPDIWFQHYPFLNERRINEAEIWRERRVLEWFKRFGTTFFQDLDIWDVDWGVGLGRAPAPVPEAVQRRREIDCMVAEAEDHQAGGNLAEAERQLTRIIEQNPGHWLALNDLGVLRAYRGDVAGAEMLLRQAHRLDPYQPQSAINIARLCQAKGDPQEGVAVLQAFLSKHPNTPHAREYVSDTLNELQRESEGHASGAADGAAIVSNAV